MNSEFLECLLLITRTWWFLITLNGSWCSCYGILKSRFDVKMCNFYQYGNIIDCCQTCILHSCTSISRPELYPHAGRVGAGTGEATDCRCMCLLAAVVVLQTLLFHLSFMLRNVSLCSRMLLLLVEFYRIRRNGGGGVGSFEAKFLLPGLPSLGESTERGTFVSLFGRILLIFFFGALGFTSDDFSFGRILFGALAAVSCLTVAVGFKAKYSKMFLVTILCVFNIFNNQWWAHSPENAERDSWDH